MCIEGKAETEMSIKGRFEMCIESRAELWHAQ